MVDYKENFKKFYEDAKLLKNNTHINNYHSYLEQGIALCILKKYLTDNDIPLGEELSIKKIFNILNIDINKNDMDFNLFKNYIILKMEDSLTILSVPKGKIKVMNQICVFDGTFVMNSEYEGFEPLTVLASDLNISLYCIESNILKLKFKNLIDEYLNENLNELILLGSIDKNNVIDSDFNLDSEMKKIISESYNKNTSIYDYLKDSYISNNLFNYVRKYPCIKKSITYLNKLLLKYKKADLISDSELLTDKVKNDFKVNIEKSIAQRRELERLIYNEWIEKKQYDMLLNVNKNSENMITELNKITSELSNTNNIVINNGTFVIFNSNSSDSYRIFITRTTSNIIFGNYTFKKIVPVIECYNETRGIMSKVIKLETLSDRENFSMHKNGVEIYPSIKINILKKKPI